jgi:hypothetical protein
MSRYGDSPFLLDARSDEEGGRAMKTAALGTAAHNGPYGRCFNNCRAHV